MNSQIPGWVWFFTGLMSGLFIAFLIYLGRVPAGDEEARASATASPGMEQKAGDEEGDLPFQFYDIFPRNEVPVVEERMNEKLADDSVPSRYFLQTGSFANAEDADRMRAQLLLLGLEATTRNVTVKGELRHRVLVGPLDDRGALNRALDTLAESEIESIALKEPIENP